MYNYRYRRFGWVPVVLFLFVLFAVFSGGFHHGFFFFAPLFLCFPFIVVAGLGMLFAMKMRHGGHWRHGGEWSKRKYGYYHDDASHRDNDNDIFYA